ncbi:hypothetical protein Tco_0539339 [Tanacetum coccineum]
MKAQELKTKTSAQTLIYKIFLQRYQVYQGRLLASFQDDAKYEHVGQDTRSQGGKDDQDKQDKYLKISDEKDKNPKLGLWYPKDSPFDLVAYTDSDYAEASLDRKSTTRGFQFLGCRLISWQCKKQTVVANSIIEAEYIAASSCYGQRVHVLMVLEDDEEEEEDEVPRDGGSNGGENDDEMMP